MFRKPFKRKICHHLRKSERENLLEAINSYPGKTENLIDELIESKIVVYKKDLPSGKHVRIYYINKIPSYFEVDDKICPTVFVLEKYPDLLVSFETHEDVFEKLAAGAGLMLPGTILDKKNLPTFESNWACSIRITGNPNPVAVGITNMSSKQVRDSSDNRGKLVITLHTRYDKLWHEGNQALQLLEVVSDENDADCEDENEDYLVPESMDELLQQCFLYALKKDGKNLKLPIDTGTFYRNHVMSYCPVGHKLEIRNSRYKQLSKFLNVFVAKKLIEVIKKKKKGKNMKRLSESAEVISVINFDHESLKNFKIPKWRLEGKREDEPRSDHNPRFEVLYQVTSAVLPLLNYFEREEGNYEVNNGLSEKTVRDAVATYVGRNNLKNEKMVRLDDLLLRLFDSRQIDQDMSEGNVTWVNLNKTVLSRMILYHNVNLPNQPVRKYSGTPRKIIIEYNKKSKTAGKKSNKKCVIVRNLGYFGFDLDELYKIILKKFSRPKVKSCGVECLGIKGDDTKSIKKWLIKEYNVDQKHIVIQDGDD